MTRCDRVLPLPLALLRAVVTLHALAAFGQPVLAGQFLDGNFDLVDHHGANAILVQLLGLIQIAVALLLKWPGRGPLWPAWASALLFLAETGQATAGYTRLLGLHVPLGVAIAATTLGMAVWVWRPRLGRPAIPSRSKELADNGAVTP